jgi:hypothetical protein
MAEKGIVIDKKQLAADWLKVSGSRVQEDLLWIFINRAPKGSSGCWSLPRLPGCRCLCGIQGPEFNEYLGTHHIFQKKGCEKYKHFGGGMLACEILEKEFLKNGGKLFRGARRSSLKRTAAAGLFPVSRKSKTAKYRRYKGTKAVILATGRLQRQRRNA